MANPKIKVIIFDLGGVLTTQPKWEEHLDQPGRRYNVSGSKVLDLFYKYTPEYHDKRILSQFRLWENIFHYAGANLTEQEILSTVQLEILTNINR